MTLSSLWDVVALVSAICCWHSLHTIVARQLNAVHTSALLVEISEDEGWKGGHPSFFNGMSPSYPTACSPGPRMGSCLTVVACQTLILGMTIPEGNSSPSRAARWRDSWCGDSSNCLVRRRSSECGLSYPPAIHTLIHCSTGTRDGSWLHSGILPLSRITGTLGMASR